MFETQTYEVIMERMLARVPDTLDKREGSVIWDAIAPMAAEMAQLYIDMDFLLDNTFADTATRAYLIRRAAERNLAPEAATYAVVKAVFVPDTLEIPIGSRFSLEDLNYSVIQKREAGVYQLQCETAGMAANRLFGPLVSIDVINGLEDARITEVLILGEEEEDTEVFRERYFNSFRSQASGGNVAWYKETIHKLDGVGGVKVLRAWNGPGTVKTIITDAAYGVPTDTLIERVQAELDPEQNQGDGLGLAPIGHVVTVEAAAAEEIRIACNITYENEAAFADVQEEAERVIDKYFQELNANWENLQNIIVRISQIEARLLDVAGILDIGDTTINGLGSNYTVSGNALAVRGSFGETQ